MAAASTAAPTARVLVVEDERALAGMVETYLTRAGYRTTLAQTGPEALEAVREQEPDVVVLDLGLPGMDGIEVCRQIRTFSDCYVLVVTARTDEVDRLIGLSVGADDYITKPFSVRELVARVQTVLRRPRTGTSRSTPEEPTWVFGDLEIDPAGLEVRLRGARVDLTPIQRDLLITLASRPRTAFSRRQLINEVWGGGWVGDEHLVDSHVAHLRSRAWRTRDGAC